MISSRSCPVQKDDSVSESWCNQMYKGPINLIIESKTHFIKHAYPGCVTACCVYSTRSCLADYIHSKIPTNNCPHLFLYLYVNPGTYTGTAPNLLYMKLAASIAFVYVSVNKMGLFVKFEVLAALTLKSIYFIGCDPAT